MNQPLKDKANLNILIDMLNHHDANYSYFAASRIPFISKMLEHTQSLDDLTNLVQTLTDLRQSNRL